MGAYMGIRNGFVALVAASLVGGCTHLDVRPYAAGDPKSHSGAAYMLDFTQYTIKITRTLLKCEARSPAIIKTETSVTSSQVPDGAHLYVIDMTSLISAFKTSEMSADYKDGKLVGFNASAVSKEGEIIASLATTAGKIAMMAFAPVPVAADPTDAFQYCSEEAVARLKLISDNKKPSAEAAANLDEASAQLAVMTAQFLAKPTEKLRKQIKEKSDAIEAGRKKLDGLVKLTTEAQSWLTDVLEVKWPRDSLKFHAPMAYPLPVATSAKWLRVKEIRDFFIDKMLRTMPRIPTQDGHFNLVINKSGGVASLMGISPTMFAQRYPSLTETVAWDACETGKDASCAADAARLLDDLIQVDYAKAVKAPISLHIVARGSYGSETAGGIASTDPKAGLRYRVPAAAALYICEQDEDCHLETGKTPISVTEGSVAQLGTVFNIPFSSPMFASGSIGVTLDEQSRLLKVTLKRDTATALGAATALGQVVDQGAAFQKALAQAPLTDLQNQAKILTAQKTVDDLKAGMTKTPLQLVQEELAIREGQQKIAAIDTAMAPSVLKDRTNQLALAQLDVQIAEAERKLAADPQADLALVRQQYAAQTDVLNARKASIEAETAVLVAQRALTAEQAK